MKSKASLIKLLNVILITFLVLYIAVNVYNHGILTSKIIMSIILLLVVIPSLGKNLKLDSTKALGEYIEECWSKEFWYEDKNIKAEKLSGNYYLTVSITKLITIFCLFIFGNSIFNSLNYTSELNLKNFLVPIIVLIIQATIYFAQYFKLCRLLTKQCDPYLCILAFYKIMSIERGKEFRVSTPVKLFVANTLIYTGDFYFPIEYLNLIYKEHKLSELMKCEMNYNKFFCLFSSGRYEEAAALKIAFEEKIEKNNKLKRNAQVKKFLQGMEKCYWMINEDYTLIINDAEEVLKKVKVEVDVIKVNYNFKLYKAYKALGHLYSAQKCKDYVLSHGNTTYYVSKCREN